MNRAELTHLVPLKLYCSVPLITPHPDQAVLGWSLGYCQAPVVAQGTVGVPCLLGSANERWHGPFVAIGGGSHLNWPEPPGEEWHKSHTIKKVNFSVWLLFEASVQSKMLLHNPFWKYIQMLKTDASNFNCNCVSSEAWLKPRGRLSHLALEPIHSRGMLQSLQPARDSQAACHSWIHPLRKQKKSLRERRITKPEIPAEHSACTHTHTLTQNKNTHVDYSYPETIGLHPVYS